MGAAVFVQGVDLAVHAHGGLDDLHIFGGAAHVLGVHQFCPGFLHAVDAEVLAVDVEDAEFIPLGQSLVAEFPAQGSEQLVAENGLGIVLTGPDAQGIVDIGALVAPDGVVEGAGAVAATEIDLKALLGIDQAGVAVELQAAVDGEALPIFKELQIALDLPVGPVLGIDAGGAEELVGIGADADHRQGVVLVDDVGGGDHIAGELALLQAYHPDDRGGIQDDGGGVALRAAGGNTAVSGVVQGAFTVEGNGDAPDVVEDAVGSFHDGSLRDKGNPGSVFGPRGWSREVEGTVFAVYSADAVLIGHIVDAQIVAAAVVRDAAQVDPALFPAEGEGGVGVAAVGQLRVAGADDHNGLTGFQSHIGQTEFVGDVWIIGQGVMCQIDRGAGDVLQLQPVVVFAVGLDQIRAIGGHDLADDQIAGRVLGGPEGLVAVLSVGKAGGGVWGFFVGAVGLKGPGTVLTHPGDFHLVDHIAHGAGEDQGNAVPVQ